MKWYELIYADPNLGLVKFEREAFDIYQAISNAPQGGQHLISVKLIPFKAD